MDPETYLSSILGGLVQYPTDLKIERSEDELGVLLKVSLAKPDMGRVIGKEGTTIKAVRRLIDACGLSKRQRVSVKILEPA